jgi:hypothetical protein
MSQQARKFPGQRKNFKKNPDPSKTSLLDTVGDELALKLKRHVEDNIKRKIKAAQADPEVVKASKKFMS